MPSSFLRHLPNFLSLLRLFCVPLLIAFIAGQVWVAAFSLFLLAGLSDALDGWIAKKFSSRTELGAYLDPLADKALLISAYIALSIVGIIPIYLACLVAFRDLMIIGAVLISWGLSRPMAIHPLLVSKLNTTAQIGFALLVLAAQAFEWKVGGFMMVGIYLVAFLTLASAFVYMRQWLRHMA